MKTLWNTFGFIFLAVGVVGVFVPILPTTPFLLLAAFGFSKGSERFHVWLTNHKYLGPPIRDWYHHGVIRKKAKMLAVSMITISMSYPIFFKETRPFLKIIMVVTYIVVVWFILSRPSHIAEKIVEKNDSKT